MNLYTDNDPFCCQWLRNLIAEGVLPAGEVWERDVKNIRADELVGFTAQHFFAGTGAWQLALDLAGWPRDRPCATASCPCQPFSSAGKQKGQEDPRHLWPVLFRLVRECLPPVLFGEQVASDDGYRWLARVRDEMETAGYAVGCADLPAACAGAPHIRQRLFFVARRVGNAHLPRANVRTEGSRSRPVTGQSGGSDLGVEHPEVDGREEPRSAKEQARGRAATGTSGTAGAADGLAHDDGERRPERPQSNGEPKRRSRRPSRRADAGGCGGDGGVGDTDVGQRGDGGAECGGQQRLQQERRVAGWPDVPDPARLPGLPDDLPSGGEIGYERRADGPAAGAGDESGSGMGKSQRERQRGHSRDVAGEARSPGTEERRGSARDVAERPGTTDPWSDFRIIPCRDSKWRRVPVEPGFQPLAHGSAADARPIIARLVELGYSKGCARRLVREARANRVGRLRGFGNAIVIQVAAMFIRAFLQAEGDIQ